MQLPKPLNSMLKNTLNKSIQYGAKILHNHIPMIILIWMVFLHRSGRSIFQLN